jgi:hypothetical protein
MPLRSSPKYHGHGDFTTSEILDAFGKMIQAVNRTYKGYEIVSRQTREVLPSAVNEFGALDL